MTLAETLEKTMAITRWSISTPTLLFASPGCCFGWFWILRLDGAPSNYIRSGSNAPSPTHLLLRPAKANTGTGCILLPPHGMSHQHSALFYNQTGLSPLHSRSPPTHQSHDPMNGTAPVSTYDDLKRHYDGLTDKQKNIDEMSEKNQRMMSREVLTRCSVVVGTRCESLIGLVADNRSGG